MKHPRIVVVGGAGIDHVARLRGPAMPGASSPGTASATPGGVGYNVAAVLARLGNEVTLVSRIGDDAAGATLAKALESLGIDRSGLEVEPGAATASYLAALDHEGNLILGIAAMDIFDRVDSETVRTALRQGATAAFAVLDANIAPDVAAAVGEGTDAAAIPLAGLAVSPAKCTRLAPVLGRLAVLFANRKEAATLLGLPPDTGRSAAGLAAALVGPGGPKAAVVSDAASPLAVADRSGVRTFAPLPAKVQSVNGAGDALAAGTIHALAAGAPLHTAIRTGLAAAAITVEHPATVPPALDAAAVAARMRAAG